MTDDLSAGDFLFDIERRDGCTTIRCKFCRRIRWAGYDTDAPKMVMVCECDDAMSAAAVVLRNRPATLEL